MDGPDTPSVAVPTGCSGEVDELRTLLGLLAPGSRSIAGMHRTLGFDLPPPPAGYRFQGARPAPVLVVKGGAVGWLAGGQASWMKGPTEQLIDQLSTPPSVRPSLWWQSDSQTGVVTEFSKDTKGRRNTAPGMTEGDEPLVAVHPGASWELVVGALRGLAVYGYSRVQLLFGAALPEDDEVKSDRTVFALWHPETGLTPLNFDHDPKELASVRECAPAYHLLRALPMMDWNGRVRALSVALPQRLSECQCRADFPKLQATLVSWLNAGDTRTVPVAVSLSIAGGALDGIQANLGPRAGAAWSTVVADALPK